MFPSESVRILRISKQKPSSITTTPHSLKLTFFDLYWHFTPPFQFILFYNANTHFPTLVHKLRESLSLALQHFYPLAGKLVWSPDSDELGIQCGNQGDGLLFIQAETDADFHRLVGESIHDVDTYRKLVPSFDISELQTPLLWVQFTRFASGGVCIGVCGHHMAMDAAAFWHFMKSWAEICRSGEMMVKPCHDRGAIQDPHGVTKSFMEVLRPSLPKVKIRHLDLPKIMRRTFMLTAANIRSLKLRAAKQQRELSTGHLSTFLAISAHAWVSAVRARHVHQDESTVLLIPANCRSRLEPPVVPWYFGNCLKTCIVHAKGFDLLGDPGFWFAIRAIRESIRATLEEPSKLLHSKSRNEKVMTIASSPKFGVYGTDFGWGGPSRVELVSMNGEGSMVLQDNRDDEGGVQLSIALAPHHIEEFAKLILDGLDDGVALFSKI